MSEPRATTPRNRPRPRRWWVLGGILPILVLVLVQGLSTRDTLAGSLQCPGAHCTTQLRSVYDELARIPSVTAVERIYRDQSLASGASGGADVQATLTTRAAAARLAGQIRDLYLASDVPTVGRVTVVVVPEPELSSPAVDRSTTTYAAVDPCADAACSAQVAAFRTAFADSDLAISARLTAVTHTTSASGPLTRIAIDAGSAVLDPAAIAQVRTELLAVAHTASLDRIGDVALEITFVKQTAFSFSFDR